MSLTAGLRYTSEDKTLTAFQIRRAFSGVDIVPPGTVRTAANTAWTPRLGVEFKPSTDSLIYAYAARGFKSGGINGRVFDLNAFRAFQPETVWTYEGGFKTDWFEHRLRINGAAFYNDYKNIQLTIQDTTTGTVSNFITNAAAGRSYGVELEVSARPVRALDIGVSGTFIDTKYTQSRSTDIPVGAVFQKTPKWAGIFYGQYDISLAGGLVLTPRIDIAVKSSYFNDALRSASLAENGYTLVNGRITLAKDRTWSLAAFVTNLTDARYVVAGLDGRPNGVGSVERVFARPREFGASLSYHF